MATRKILRTLFPSWLPPAFKVMFAKPFPVWSNKLNAWVTGITCQWLMGPSAVNDVELADGSIGKDQGVLVERCGPAPLPLCMVNGVTTSLARRTSPQVIC